MRLLRDPSPALRKGVADLQRAMIEAPDPFRRPEESAVDILRRAQELYRSMFPEPLPPEAQDDERVLRLINSYDEAQLVVTDGDSALNLMELYDTWDDVARAGRHMAEYGAYDIFLCTAREGAINARTFVLDEDPTHVIMLNGRIFDFLADLAWTFTNAFDGDLRNEKLPAFKRFVVTPRPLASGANPRFDRAVEAFIGRHATGDATAVSARDWSLANPSASLALALYDCMKYFVIGHELGHIHLGHFGEKRMWRLRPGEGPQTDVGEFDRSWTQEFEADTFGLELGMCAAFENGYYPEFVGWAALLVFIGGQWIERYQALAAGAPTEAVDPDLRTYSSHPPLGQRRAAMEELLELLNNGEPDRNLGFRLEALEWLDQELLARIDQRFDRP